MFDFIFDPDTNGIVLQESEKPLRREIRPVYCHELDMLGLKNRWRYSSDDSAPVMWAINNFYFYKGRKVMKIQGGSCHSAPVVTVLERPSLWAYRFSYVISPG